jgi:hypothetical protein
VVHLLGGLPGAGVGDVVGQRLGVYVAEAGTADYDAMVLLDMTAPRQAARPAAQQEH